MKISELQKILECYKKEYGNLEVRLAVEAPSGKQHKLLDYAYAIDVHTIYNKKEFDNLTVNKGLPEELALDILNEKGLFKTYLDIYTYTKE